MGLALDLAGRASQARQPRRTLQMQAARQGVSA
jgi:hypothetical protein